MGFSTQEYWSVLSFHLPNPGIEPGYLMSPTLAGRFFTTIATWEAQIGRHPVLISKEHKVIRGKKRHNFLGPMLNIYDILYQKRAFN